MGVEFSPVLSCLFTGRGARARAMRDWPGLLPELDFEPGQVNLSLLGRRRLEPHLEGG
jgi:hypothetical protein